MTPRELVRRSLLAGLGLAPLACSADGLASAGADVVNLPTPSASGGDPLATNPSASVKRRTPQTGPSSGYVKETNGVVHRAGPTTCDTTIDTPACKGTEHFRDCSTDAECTAALHGKCTTWIGQAGDGCGCSYAFESDADCASHKGTVCVCKEAAQEPHSTCVRASCPADDACTSGLCAVSRYDEGCGASLELACKTVNDDCQSALDCEKFDSCAVARDGVWKCVKITCAIGRPLTVDGRWARAATRATGDWALERASATRGVRSRDAALWSEMAALEHASVASFARFSLQLMALGAPAELVRDAQRAALDEIDHARLAYGFASDAIGRPVGPGPLPEVAHAVRMDVVDVVSALVAEGCIGETIGAIEALEEAERAEDDGVADALRRIGRDELRHAELAFRALRWFAVAHGEVALGAARGALDAYRTTDRRAAAIAVIVRPLVDAVTRS